MRKISDLCGNRISPLLFLGLYALLACSKKKNDDCRDCRNGPTQDGGGGSGQLLLSPTLDVKGGSGLLVVETSATGQGNAALNLHNKTVLDLGLPEELYIPAADFGMFLENGGNGTGGDSAGSPEQGKGDDSLKKVTSSGEVMPALTTEDTSSNTGKGNFGGPKPTLPKVLTIAISPQKEVYLHFEQPFVYKSAPAGVDVWKVENGYQCQIFRVKGGSLNELVNKDPERNNLECLDDKHFINAWQTQRSSVFQFDNEGNVYYPGALPNSPKQVVYKKNRQSGQLTEVINANICVLDFMVTPSGGVFYTGSTSCNQGGSSGNSGFFRYVGNNGGGVREIARDWWNFIFEPLKVQGEQSDKALFFGPDPQNAQTASWDSACLFYYDPSKSSPSEQYSKAIACGNNVWDWMSLKRQEDKAQFSNYSQEQWSVAPPTGWLGEYKNRCESEGQVFAGGGSQIKAVRQDAEGRAYVIGNVRRKNKGTVACTVEIKGPHCVVNTVPTLTLNSVDLNSKAICEDASVGGNWVDKGTCWDTSAGNSTVSATSSSACVATSNRRWQYDSVQYFDAKSKICTTEDARRKHGNEFHSQSNNEVTSGGTPALVFQANQATCTVDNPGSGGGGDQWTSEYQALAIVDGTKKTLKLLSLADEKAIKLWIVNNFAFYSAYNVTKGQYVLRKYNPKSGGVESVLENFETYNLNESGTDGKLLFDGLDFSNNQYVFGSIDSAAPFSKQLKSGLTGTLKTIVVFPK